MNYVGRLETFAALDLGTTNCRLLIARAGRDGLRVVDSFSRVVRLGEGLDASGELSEAAMDRALEALTVCASKINGRHVTRARFVATEACRRAANGGEFTRRVQGVTGIELEIIPTREEARLALAGCEPLLDPELSRAIVFDIGGGSTELLWVDVMTGNGRPPATRIHDVISLPHGVVSLTERYRGDDGPSAYERMVAELCEAFRGFDLDWKIAREIASGGVQMLGSSGTVTTLAAIQMGLPRYERRRVDGTGLAFCDIARISNAIVGMSTAERMAEPCIGPARADLMVAGCAILAAICKTWPVGRLTVADRGVREGILAGFWATSRARRAIRGGSRYQPGAAGHPQ